MTEPELVVLDLDPSFAHLAEMTLKRPGELRALAREEELQPRIVLHLLLIGLAGIALYSVAFTLILAFAPPLSWVPRVSLSDRTLLRPVLTYTLGMVGALGICLPSFYFYGLLAGVRATLLQVTAISLHVLANTGLVLMGILPIYVGALLGLVVLGLAETPLYPFLIGVGLILPFLAGIGNLGVMFDGFFELLRTLPEVRATRRAPMVRLLALAWAALYVAVAPVTLWAVHLQLEKYL